MAPNFPHSIFDPLSCTGTQWIVDKVMIKHSLHSVLFWDIHTARFPLDCSRAALCPCTLFRVGCRPHLEGCALRKLECQVLSTQLVNDLRACADAMQCVNIRSYHTLVVDVYARCYIYRSRTEIFISCVCPTCSISLAERFYRNLKVG